MITRYATFSLVAVTLVLSGALVLSSSLAAADTESWPAFRGADARGVGQGKNLPDKWSQTENVVWKTPIAGRGWSSPIVWGDKVFVTSAVSAGDEKDAKKGLYFGGNQAKPSPYDHRWVVWCIDFESGKVLWAKDVHAGKPTKPRHIKNNYAPETQVTDGELVYSLFGDVGLFAHDMKGEQKWHRRWTPVRTRFNWGNAASPVLHGDRIYIVNDNEDQSFIEALDKTTGKTVWSVPRDEKSNWSTPFVWSHAGGDEIITPGSGRTRSYGLDGKLLWELEAPMSSITIATPYAAHGLLYVTSGYVGDGRRPIYAIRPGAKGKMKYEKGGALPESIAWVQRAGAPYNPSTLVYGDLLYVLHDFGFFACFDAKTGEKVYGKQRIRKEGNTPFTSSPFAYDGKIFCLSEDGDCYVFAAGREHKLLHINRLDEMCGATPAIARNSLFVRTFSNLYRIAGK